MQYIFNIKETKETHIFKFRFVKMKLIFQNILGGKMKNLKMKLKRMELNLSQTELAKRVGVTRQTIGLIESGEFNPSIRLCISICKELNVTLNDLFWEEEDHEKNEK